MDKRYEAFCLTDRQFYDSPRRATAGADGAEFEVSRRAVPDGWWTSRTSEWLVCQPFDVQPPDQGWKIHVSATLENAERVLERVWDFCVGARVPFKFLPDRVSLHLRNAKYAPRGGSGKAATIYPADDRQLEAVLCGLDPLLSGEPGPYILSDLRWNGGPLYVRYGGFAQRRCRDETGELVPAIATPGGELVPDRRDPTFYLPSWVRLPDFLADALEARTAPALDDVPYEFDEALHFSNGGGVYLGTDLRTGERVVIKEARPHAGLGVDGSDAVRRLCQERDMLNRLAGVPAVPAVREQRIVAGHYFLVLEHVPGRPLNTFLAQRHPLIGTDHDPEKLAAYSRWAMAIIAATEQAVAEIHARGIVYRDLHMFNIMVDDDDSVRLVDFEAAAPVDAPRAQAVANPGFVAPADRHGYDIDRYALACLRLALFLPMTTLLLLDASKAAHLARIAAAQFPVPPGYFDDAVRVILGPEAAKRRDSTAEPPAEQLATMLGTSRSAWWVSRATMTAAIRASATPRRDDRLFPGDVEQFNSGGVGFAHGAAGVLYALAAAEIRPSSEHLTWLNERALRPGMGLGFYTGAHGVAHVLDCLGQRQRAAEVVDACLREHWQRLGHDLYGGLAGVGLNLIWFGTRHTDPVALDCAREAGELLLARLPVVEREDHEDSLRPAGLLRGESGPALLFLRLHQLDGDERWLSAAARALRLDLRRCRPASDGALKVDEGHRLMPYLGAGSAGIGMVTRRFLLECQDPEIAAADAAIALAARSGYYGQAGLFAGRAGMLLYLADRAAGAGQSPALDSDVIAQLARLGWHAMSYRGQLAFPGDQLLRLSMDLATGSAGCLLAIAAAVGVEGAHLPFLAPRDTPVAAADRAALELGRPPHRGERLEGPRTRGRPKASDARPASSRP
jgi:hypothetical protein